ncbi:hypothetical protein E2553_40455 [Paraburkholderia dipogonis]|uniref:Uncharacterized protein n=1 Tax=Paraburkholderia dipogonis TaxID=1211383 RepID=A0A4Y8MJM0_9BURK|nr:hypothetical protein [Paraburkholderia dipogonis]TFE37676.1 hypothetical protein E2553_40455 [Paraburkholderia dipogonis]
MVNFAGSVGSAARRSIQSGGNRLPARFPARQRLGIPWSGIREGERRAGHYGPFSKIKELQEMVRRTKRDFGPSQHKKMGHFPVFLSKFPVSGVLQSETYRTFTKTWIDLHFSVYLLDFASVSPWESILKLLLSPASQAM